MYRLITNGIGQNADNFLKFNDNAGCCGDAATACQYSVVIPTANAVNGISITNRDGVTEELTTGFPGTGAAAVVAAIKAALAAYGLENDNDDVTGVTSEVSGTNIIYRVTSTVPVVSMRHNTATVVAATALCARIKKCVYSRNWAGNGAASTFVVNGVSVVLGAFTLAGATAAQVQAAIIALANWPATATINVVETAAAFEIRITDVFGKTMTLDSTALTSGSCGMGYIAA
jgi:hypothetical protein